MNTTWKLLKKYGNPMENPLSFERKHMILWDVPDHINKAIGALPNKIYCNKDLVGPLEEVFKKLIDSGYHKEILTWDGCFNIRRQRGSKAISVHAFGMAVDLNAAHNPFRHTREEAIRKGLKPFSNEFVGEWVSLGWTSLPDDLMHYQWTNSL